MLQKETLNFLSELEKNNNREWFAENKSWYENSRNDFEHLVSELIQSMAQIDLQIKYLNPKKCIFRIYRDIRFSKDKTPYKTHFGAVLNEKKGCGYYIHIQPGNSFLTCGYYDLTSSQLKNIRKGIYEDYESFQNIISEKTFKKEIGDLSQDDTKLKRVPNGFDKDSPAAEYLKLKNFYVIKNLPQEKLFSNDFIAYATHIYTLMQPFYEYLEEFARD